MFVIQFVCTLPPNVCYTVLVASHCLLYVLVMFFSCITSVNWIIDMLVIDRSFPFRSCGKRIMQNCVCVLGNR